MRIMITGGGTGGHVFPGIAIVEELAKRDPQFLVQWVGKKGNIEERVCRQKGIPFRPITCAPWYRKSILLRVKTVIALLVGFCQAYFYLWKFKPQAVLAVGGYVAFPLAYLAERMNLKVFLHEQNRKLGLTNRILAERATRVFTSFLGTNESLPEGKAIWVGNPVRAGFLHPPSQAEARKSLNLKENIPVVLVVGGSQGAHQLNKAIAEAIPQIQTEEMQLLWITGTKDAPWARSIAATASFPIFVFAFFEDMPTAFAAADLVVGRAGASFTAELAIMGKPSILVPYPYATESHQEENAKAFVEKGGAVLLPDNECNGKNLLSHIREILNNPQRRNLMAKATAELAQPAAAEKLVDELLKEVFMPSEK